jgi:hypothetical protein
MYRDAYRDLYSGPYRDLPYVEAVPLAQRARELAALFLRALGATLDRLARQLAVIEADVPRREPTLEFYAEAGAPEGALYVDGLLVGHVEGVQRL